MPPKSVVLNMYSKSLSTPILILIPFKFIDKFKSLKFDRNMPKSPVGLKDFA